MGATHVAVMVAAEVAGTPPAEGPVPYAHDHVRYNVDTGDLYCRHCGTTAHVRSDQRRDIKRESYDFLVRHKGCLPVRQ